MLKPASINTVKELLKEFPTHLLGLKFVSMKSLVEHELLTLPEHLSLVGFVLFDLKFYVYVL